MDSIRVIKISDSESKIQGTGCSEMILLVQKWTQDHGANCAVWPLPAGSTHSEIILREALLKDRGLWNFPYQEDEICHCRSVLTQKVDSAIIYGCHTPERVSQSTSASTACGTCRVDVEKIIAYRLAQKS